MTDDEIVARTDFIERAETALSAGDESCALQLRAHGLGGRRLYELAVRLRVAAEAVGASLWISDRVDVALAVRADGVQLGGASLPTEAARALLGRSACIGRSIHEAGEGPTALAAGADLLVLGSIYRTGSHPEREPLGSAVLREATAVARPIVAIGGITSECVSEVLGAGAWGVAVRSGVWDATDVAGSVGRYLAALTDPS